MTIDLSLRDISVQTAPEQQTKPVAPSIWRLILRDERIVVPLKAGDKGPALYCIHSVGGDLHGYDRLAKALDNQRRMYGVQVPKSMMAESASLSIESMARRYTEALVRFQPDGPFVIAGYSAGAVIGLEVAQQLRALGRDVPLLIAFDGAPLTKQAIPGPASFVWRLFYKMMWRLASARLRDFRFKNLRSRIEFKRIIAGESAARGRKVERDAVCKIATRDGWSENQKRFIIETYKAMMAYSPDSYTGKVILYAAYSQPLLQKHEYRDSWKIISDQCEIVNVRARHSDFFDSPAALNKIAYHLECALRKI